MSELFIYGDFNDNETFRISNNIIELFLDNLTVKFVLAYAFVQ